MNLVRLINEELPKVLPHDWRILGDIGIWNQTVTGLRILYSISTIDDGRKFHHISFSREDRIPGWEEMRDTLYELPWLRKNKEVFMTLPPKEEYVALDLCPFVMHWWQEIEENG